MKIAVASDDGKKVSQHFGSAPLYVVVTVEDGKIVDREVRSKASHQHGQHTPGIHQAMGSSIGDCSVMIVGNMGWGAYQSLLSQKLEPFLTDVEDVEQAISGYLDKSSVNRTDKLH